MAKDETEVGITGQPVPKPRTAKQQYELEKKRRMRKHLGKNVGGKQYDSGVNPYFNPRSVKEEVIVDYLLGEGFASDEKSAQAIAGAMSEEWKQSVVEAREEEGKSKEEKRAIRTARSGRTGPNADYERRGEHRVADERSKDLADIRKGKKKDSSHFSYLP